MLGDVAVQVRIANPLLLVQSIHLQVQVQSIHAPPDPDSCPTFSSLLQAQVPLQATVEGWKGDLQGTPRDPEDTSHSPEGDVVSLFT